MKFLYKAAVQVAKEILGAAGSIEPVRPARNETEPMRTVQHSVPVAGNKAVWAIVSDFTLLDAIIMTRRCAAAFEKLGKVETAKSIRDVLKNSEELK